MPYIIVEGDLDAKKEQSVEKFITAVSGLKGLFTCLIKFKKLTFIIFSSRSQ